MDKVIITGTSSGLGYETSKQLISKGVKVIGLSRKNPAFSSNYVHISCDLSSKESIESAVKEILKKHSDFDALINCAGMLNARDTNNLKYDELEYSLKVNLIAPIILTSELLEQGKQNSADFLFVTSIAIKEYYPKFDGYSAAKAGLENFVHNLQIELAQTKCRIINFCPGGFKSNIWKKATGDKVKRDENIRIETSDMAALLIHILNIPKKMEVQNIVINQK